MGNGPWEPDRTTMRAHVSGKEVPTDRMNTPRIITLTTDFGTRDQYVAAMKGVILSITPEARVVDVTHEVPPQNVREAAYILASVTPYFPEKSIHVAVVDPGVGSERRPLAVRTARAFYVVPDNGLLTPVLRAEPPEEIVHLNNPTYWLSEVSHTFHGRDIFAPVAAYLARGVPLNALGTPLSPEDIVWLPWPDPRALPDGSIEGMVVHVDHFGNIVTNIPADMLDGDPEAWEFRVGQQRLQGLKRTYSDVDVGEPLALIGSNNTLEFSVREGNAAALWHVQAGDPVRAWRTRRNA